MTAEVSVVSRMQPQIANHVPSARAPTQVMTTGVYREAPIWHCRRISTEHGVLSELLLEFRLQRTE